MSDQPAKTHLVRIFPGHDCIRFECKWHSSGCAPGKSGFHGKSGARMMFVTKGPLGAISFAVGTGWFPQPVGDAEDAWLCAQDWGTHPYPMDISYHSYVPMYEGQEVSDDECCWLDGKPCYCDGSGLQAINPMYALVNGGDEALWAFLDAYYEYKFNNAPCPVPAEYPTALRVKEGANV